MARWPDVPDVYGWLSLTEHGQWRLHPQGDALDAGGPGDGTQASPSSDADPSSTTATGAGSPGEAITSPPILSFIDRNYTHDDRGQWYFQNGPQKVYVRLDGAPYILQTSTSSLDALRLRTHNGLDVDSVDSWWLDHTGRLFAMTAHGAGLIAGRDLSSVLAALKTADGESLIDILDDANLPLDAGTDLHVATAGGTVRLSACSADDIPERLGFVRSPRPLQDNGAAAEGNGAPGT